MSKLHTLWSCSLFGIDNDNVVFKNACKVQTIQSTELKHFMIAIEMEDNRSSAAIRYEENGQATKDLTVVIDNIEHDVS